MIGQYIYTIWLLTTLNEAFRRRLSSIHIPSLSNYKPLSERNAPQLVLPLPVKHDSVMQQSVSS